MKINMQQPATGMSYLLHFKTTQMTHARPRMGFKCNLARNTLKIDYLLLRWRRSTKQASVLHLKRDEETEK